MPTARALRETDKSRPIGQQITYTRTSKSTAQRKSPENVNFYSSSQIAICFHLARNRTVEGRHQRGAGDNGPQGEQAAARAGPLHRRVLSDQARRSGSKAVVQGAMPMAGMQDRKSTRLNSS